MRTAFKVLAVILALTFVVSIVNVIRLEGTKVVDTYTYEGEILMDADEYSAFNLLVASEDLNIIDYRVYSWTPPHFVIFTMEIPSELASIFPGEKVSETYIYPYPRDLCSTLSYISGFLLLFVVFYLALAPKRLL